MLLGQIYWLNDNMKVLKINFSRKIQVKEFMQMIIERKNVLS